MKKLFLILLVFSFSYCATSNAGIALSNVPITKNYKVISQVKKTSSWLTFDIGFIGIPLKKPPINELIDEALKEKKADALVNIRYWNDRMVFFFITVNRIGFSAEAITFQQK